MESSPSKRKCSYYEQVLDKQRQRRYKEAKQLLLEGGENGEGDCMAVLGYYYNIGIWFERDNDEGRDWLYRGIQVGNTKAMTWGLWFLQFSQQKRMELISKIMASDDNFAKGCYRGHPPDEKSLVFLKEASDMYSQYAIGYLYSDVDMKEYVKWKRESAEQGYYAAQDSLGHCYEHGKGIGKDYKKAMYWYRLAMEQGSIQGGQFYKRLYNQGYRMDWSAENHWLFEKDFQIAQFTFLLCLQRNQIWLPKDLRKLIIKGAI